MPRLNLKLMHKADRRNVEHGSIPESLSTLPSWGKACIRGQRVTVGTVVSLLAAGRSAEEIMAAYPYLEREDIDQCLAYAAWRLEERELPLSLP